MSKLNNKNNSGFTLVELIIIIVFIGLLVGFSAPVYNRSQDINNIDLATLDLTQALRRAQVLSRASDGDSTWGVYVIQGEITLFKGTSYVARDSSFDETYSIADNISVSGLQEIVFDKLSGDPQSTGTITFTVNTNANKTITINSKGMLSY